MALKKRPVYQYQPINETPDIAIGVPLPFNKSSVAKQDYFRSATFGDSVNYSGSLAGGTGVFGQTFSTEEQALSNLKNLLMTYKGERYMQPNFGTAIREVLFDNNTEDLRKRLEDTINEDIAFWLPYIRVNTVDIVNSADMHSISMRIHFQVTTIGSEMVINILLSENELVVSDAEPDTGEELQAVGFIGAGSAFDLGSANETITAGTGLTSFGGGSVGGGGGGGGGY